MHFNTKYIFRGESESEMIKKINYNFDQIISFAVGPDGQRGPKGLQGIPGPAGSKGITGPTGQRSTNWLKQNTAPATGTVNPYDYWIDSASSDYSVYSYGITGSFWVPTGYSLFSSPYFETYEDIIGPGGATDKFVIGFKSSGSFLIDNLLTVSDASLVISDRNLNPLKGNPNRSKLVIATDDQTSRPILSFSKTKSANSGIPSFYWETTGNNSDLIFRTGGNFSISALMGLTVDSYTAASLLTGNSASFTSTGNITLGGTGDFYLNSNTTTGIRSNFLVNSLNVVLTPSRFTSNSPTKITNTSRSSGYVLDTTKNSTSSISTSGIEIYGGSSVSTIFEFRDSNNANIFSSSVKGPVSSTNYGQTTIGSTGGFAAGGTGGPYTYHVKRTTEYRQSTFSASCLGANNIATTTSTLPTLTVRNIFDISTAESMKSDVIVITPTTYESPSTTSVYVKIPTSFQNSLSGVYYNGTASSYRIVLNDISSAPTYYLGGLVFNYYEFQSFSNSYVTKNYYVPFGTTSTCYYIDIFYSPVSGLTNQNPRIFWKTCDGKSGFLTTTNKNTVGNNFETSPNISQLFD